MVIWTQIEEFPGYSVSQEGRVRNDEFDRILTPSRTGGGHVMIGMVRNGVQYKRALARLVLTHHVLVPEPEFNTPIHLDSDLANCHVDNLMWRPRWFAHAFSRQFNDTYRTYPRVRIKDDARVLDVWETVMKYGLLLSHIVRSAEDGIAVFPTMHRFEWV